MIHLFCQVILSCCYLEGHWWWFCYHMSRWGDDGLLGRSAQSECRCRGGDMSGLCGLLWCHTTCRCCPPDLWPADGRSDPLLLRQLRSLCETEWWWWDVYCDWLQRICFFLYLECRDVTHLSRAELCPPPGHSWGPAGPKTWLSCPESQRRSSILPTCTESECDLFKQNGELYYTGVMQFQAFLYRNICVDNLPCLQTDFKTL